ncbi:FAD binding domain protein [Burkholderia pseudomallei]|nr:FAD binding domain protein [Burkholderia pseudomallei]CAJ7297641.1 FAD binding domain protein [Burkholderia pseudomallei]
MPAVIVIGAGISGLSLALELHARGYDCRVFDAAPNVASAGVGINIQDYASRHLHRLGLEDELQKTSVSPLQAAYASAAGQILLKDPIGFASGSGFPQYSIHRMALQRVLLHAVEQRLGKECVSFGHTFLHFQQDQHGVTANFQASSTYTTCGDLLVGCDGVHSAVCRQLQPHLAKVRQSGITMWRGLTRGIVPPPQPMVVRCGRIETGKIVTYPIRDPDKPDEVVMNWVAEWRDGRRMKERHINVSPSSVPDIFFSMTLDGFDIPSLIQRADFVLQLPMTDRDPLPYWSQGRATLLGDAAHPMYPVGSNGAGQAIVDAATLAASLDTATSLEAGLQIYESLRGPATAAIVQHDRAGGPDVVLDAIHKITGGKRLPENMQPEVANQLHVLLARYQDQSGLAAPQRLASDDAPCVRA